jgi:hypothetical protein
MRAAIHTMLSIATALTFAAATAQATAAEDSWQEEFGMAQCTMKSTGKNQYFVLEPGYQLVLEGGDTKVQITVLDETKVVDGVTTRVVEEREWKDGELYEIARNYFAVCEETNDAFYFGENVDYYENGKIVKHDGTWLAGEEGNKAGLIMPASPKPGMKYYQEMAPGIAMDRAEVISIDEPCETPAGSFTCMKVKEGTSMNVLEAEYKLHAPGIGLVGDEDLKLIKHGFVDN